MIILVVCVILCFILARIHVFSPVTRLYSRGVYVQVVILY